MPSKPPGSRVSAMSVEENFEIAQSVFEALEAAGLPE